MPAQQASNARPAQPAPDDKPVATLKVQAREVLLPVTVRDKKGALVTTLDKGDFTLTEDGRPQVIKSFSHETNLPYKLGLLVDTSRSVSGALENERKAGVMFVDAMLPAEPRAKDPDEAFLIHFDRQVELLEDFTTSREKLQHELDDMGASHQTRDDSQGPETTGDDRERPTRGGRGGTQLYDAIFLASDELMKHKDGRKALVVFSDGVDRGSKDTMNDAIDAADRANVVIFTIYFKGEEERSRIRLSRRRPPRRDGLSGRRWWVSGWGRRLSRRRIGHGTAIQNLQLTARRSWPRLPSVPAATPSRLKKGRPGCHLQADRRGTAQPVPADLYAR